jgi:hypothetical protein
MEIDDGQEKIDTAEDANGKRRLGHKPLVGLSLQGTDGEASGFRKM